MIIDNFLTFSGAWASGTWTPQSIVGTGNITSTNVLDTNPASTGAGANQPLDLGAGEQLRMVFDIVTAVAGATSVEFQIVTADDAAISTNVQVISTTGAIAIASLTAAKQFTLGLGRSAPYVTRRYLACRYVIVGTSTTGTVLANLTNNYNDAQNQFYKTGFAVL